MEQQQIAIILESAGRFHPPPGVRFSYGTAGFRADASLLASTVFRAGILAVLRSLKTGAAVGLMITASHNAVGDNGVKIADPSGGMLTQQWEPFADPLVNAQSPDVVVQIMLEFVKKEEISFESSHSTEILLARDNRPSGEVLLNAAKQGINAIIGAVAIDMGMLTTPQLHWMVRCRNKGLKTSELDYFIQLSRAFLTLVDLIPEEKVVDEFDIKLLVDAANGIGGMKLEARCASLDGDADRLVCFHLSSSTGNEIKLVDGDKILSLFALFIKEQISILNKDIEGCNSQFPVKLGIVQTAYANRASTKYLKECGLDVVLTPTGVKYLHSKASEYDIGIYFEANGHGTVLSSEGFLLLLEAKVNELSSASPGSTCHKAAQRLLGVSQLINQAVGDAISGLLLVEAILRHKGWSIESWSKLYNDLPSRQMKVKVADRNSIVTTNAETQVVQPPDLQQLIDAETSKVKCSHGRCFVRPSGTEDVVRVYAEASTQEQADNLAQSVVQIVDRLLGFSNSS